MKRFMIPCLVPLLWLCVGCVSKPVQSSVVLPPSELVELLGKRLEIGREVAWTKYQRDLPILDAVREQQLLERMEDRARELNLDPQQVRQLFEAQIAASRAYQEECIAKWKSTGELPTSAPLELAQQIRPILDNLGESILKNLDANSLHSLSTEQAYQYLRAQGFSEKVTRLVQGH